jgi:hypothetical protein
MLKKIFAGICLTTLCVAGFAGVEETREALGDFCGGNPEVLRGFDRVAGSWEAYADKHGNEWDMGKLLDAVEFAAEKHAGQTRKDADKTPYIIHPIGVSELLWNVGNIRSVNVLAAALLHDTLEDTDATEAEIKERFGERILYTVKEVTNDPALSGEENKQRQIEHAPALSLDAQLVKLADRLYNVRDLQVPPPGWSQAKVDAYYGWGEKLLLALRGTNEGLETALQERIDSHRGKDADPCIRLHTVNQAYATWLDEGNRIHEYHFVLDDDSLWTFPSALYEKNNISLHIGDEVEVTFLGGGLYLMNILSEKGSRIVFERATCGVKCFYALEVQ